MGRARTDRSFLVPKQEIVEKDYDLSINRYKETVYEKAQHDSPREILDRLAAMEEAIQEKMEELRGMLG